MEADQLIFQKIFNYFSKNRIFGNGKYSIDVGLNGVNTNDYGDPDSGLNGGQNAAIIFYAGETDEGGDDCGTAVWPINC